MAKRQARNKKKRQAQRQAKACRLAAEMRVVREGMETPEAIAQAKARLPHVPGWAKESKGSRIDRKAKIHAPAHQRADFGAGQYHDPPSGWDARKRVGMWAMAITGQYGLVLDAYTAWPGSMPVSGTASPTSGATGHSPAGQRPEKTKDTKGFIASIWMQVRDDAMQTAELLEKVKSGEIRLTIRTEARSTR